MNESVMNIDKLSKKFGKTNALKDVSIIFKNEGIVGLIGENGAGKTTLLKIIAGLNMKSSGSISLSGNNFIGSIPERQKVVYSASDSLFDRNLRIHELINIYDSCYPRFDKKFAEMLLQIFKLDSKSKYGKLSKGKISIINFILALSARAEITLLDEPMLGVDSNSRALAHEIILKEFIENSRLIIISSHHMYEIENILSEVVVIHEGNVTLHEEVSSLVESVYKLTGNQTDLMTFIADKKHIHVEHGGFSSMAVVCGLTDSILNDARGKGFAIQSLKLDELCHYMTNNRKGVDLECLWTKEH